MSGLLIQQAYVRFEDTVYHQTTGIPMGINPAVYYANLYLVSYELDFLEQFLPLLRIGRNIPAVPVYPGPMVDVVDRMVSCITAADLLAADLQGTPYLRFAASQLLDQFRWIKRYADDITVGPNRFIESLLYTDQWVLGGRIHGLYPGMHLTLERQDSTIHKCVALDMRILTTETAAISADQAHEPGFAFSYAVLYDRRRLPGFASFAVLRFQHVTSCKTQAQAYNMLHGRLCHLMRIVMHKACFVLEAARCIHHMRRSGYEVGRCFNHTKRFLKKYPSDAYNTPHWQLFEDIVCCYHRIDGDATLISGVVDEWTPTHHSTVAPLHPACSSDMDISDSSGSDMDID